MRCGALPGFGDAGFCHSACAGSLGNIGAALISPVLNTGWSLKLTVHTMGCRKRFCGIKFDTAALGTTGWTIQSASWFDDVMRAIWKTCCSILTTYG